MDGCRTASHKQFRQCPPIFRIWEGWLSDRNCDLRNAIEFGNTGLVGQIGALIGQGASQLGSLGRDAPMDGQSKSSLMSSLIDIAEAKRRCITVASASGVQQ